MKSKELIRLLQKEDPTGETEVSVGNHDIFSIHTEPAYYDGKLQLLIRDPKLAPYYDVVGARYVSSGYKIVITSMSVTDVLWDNPDAKIEYPAGCERYKAQDDAARKASRDVKLKIEMDAFYCWAKEKAAAIRPEEEIRSSANYFYEKNLSPEDPVKDLPPVYDEKNKCFWQANWNDRRAAWWDDNVTIIWESGWEITKKGS